MSVNYPRELGRAFADEEVARSYRHRQPYPAEVFTVLEGLLVEPRTILDAGCGPGALTIGLSRFAERSTPWTHPRRCSSKPPPGAVHIASASAGSRGERRTRRFSPLTASSPPAPASTGWTRTSSCLASAPYSRLAAASRSSTARACTQKANGAEFIAVIKKYSPLVDHAGFDDVVRGLAGHGALRA